MHSEAIQPAVCVDRKTLCPPSPIAYASHRTEQPFRCRTPVMELFYSTLERAARGCATVLIRGESGTGKALAARALHAASPRASGPFVKIDCASLPEHLLESELFGFEKGAFTGALARKPGRIELAHGGTLLLDEIGELGPALQAKLLRLLQDREFERLGGTTTQRVDVRVLAATHRDLESMVGRGQFREDLFYRLNVVPLWLPPLRVLGDDIEGLARHFFEELGRVHDKAQLWIDPEALRLIRKQPWPGNVRQLRNFVECVLVLGSGSHIRVCDVQLRLAAHLRSTTAVSPGGADAGHATLDTLRNPEPTLSEQRERPEGERLEGERPEGERPEPGPEGERCEGEQLVQPLHSQLRAAEHRALAHALAATRQNRSMAARLLRISRTQLYVKLREHGLLEARSA